MFSIWQLFNFGLKLKLNVSKSIGSVLQLKQSYHSLLKVNNLLVALCLFTGDRVFYIDVMK